MTYAPSPSSAIALSRKGIKNVDLWQRGINMEKFSPRHRNETLRRSIGAENIPLLLYVGRLVKEKDLDDLVHACHLLRLWGNTFKLVFVGDGPMKKYLMRRLPDAHFAGYQHGPNLSRWYASADIFVFPSTTETFGNVILEAFASGIPAVGVNQGGVADLITPGMDGLLAEPNAPRSLAEQIQILLAEQNFAS
jgi:glycosyltransferase involved in cell wall biosynthesis